MSERTAAMAAPRADFARIREAAFGVTQHWLSEPCLTLDGLKPLIIELIEALDAEADARDGEG